MSVSAPSQMEKLFGRAAHQSLIILISYSVITVISANINSPWFPTGKSYFHNLSTVFLSPLPNDLSNQQHSSQHSIDH